MDDPHVRSCTLIIAGERYVGFEIAAEFEDAARAFGFISGPANVLKRARFLSSVELQLDGGMKRGVKILFVDDSGLALCSFDPSDWHTQADASPS